MVTLSPVASPERTATVRVFAGAEVFFFEFAGHDSVDFAYDDEERPEALQERILRGRRIIRQVIDLPAIGSK